jgi:ribosome-binding protein aMBF1 (putative translation factor)
MTTRKVSPGVPVAADPDDLDAYIATFDNEERQALSAAETAMDIAILLHRAREHRGLSQDAAARRAGLQQQAISRLEQHGANPQLETIRTYLSALGFGMEVSVIDLDTGEAAFSMLLPPASPKQSA